MYDFIELTGGATTSPGVSRSQKDREQFLDQEVEKRRQQALKEKSEREKRWGKGGKGKTKHKSVNVPKIFGEVIDRVDNEIQYVEKKAGSKLTGMSEEQFQKTFQQGDKSILRRAIQNTLAPGSETIEKLGEAVQGVQNAPNSGTGAKAAAESVASPLGVPFRIGEDLMELGVRPFTSLYNLLKGPDDDGNYLDLDFQTELFRPETAPGRVGQQLGTFLVGLKGATKLLQSGKYTKVGTASQLAGGSGRYNRARLTQDGIASLLATAVVTDVENPREAETLSNLLEDVIGPDSTPAVIRALSVDEDDGWFEVLAKNGVEDLGFSVVGGLIEALVVGRRTYKQALSDWERANPGKSLDEAAKEEARGRGIEALVGELPKAAERGQQAAIQEKVLFSDQALKNLQRNRLRAQELLETDPWRTPMNEGAAGKDFLQPPSSSSAVQGELVLRRPGDLDGPTKPAEMDVSGPMAPRDDRLQDDPWKSWDEQGTPTYEKLKADAEWQQGGKARAEAADLEQIKRELEPVEVEAGTTGASSARKGAQEAAEGAPTPKAGEPTPKQPEGASQVSQAPQRAEDVDPRQQELDELEAERFSIEEELDNPNTADTPDLLPQERSATLSTISPNQYRFDAAQNPSVVTDAQMKISGTDDEGYREIVRQLNEQIDFEELARKNNTTVEEMVRQSVDQAASAWARVQGGEEMEDVLRELGLTEPSPSGKPRFVLSEEDQRSMVIARMLMKQAAEKAYRMSFLSEDAIQKGVDLGNLDDRMLDGWLTLAQAYKTTTLTLGRNLQQQQWSLKTALPNAVRALENANTSRMAGQVEDSTDRFVADMVKIQKLVKQGKRSQAAEKLQLLGLAAKAADGDPAKMLTTAQAISKLGWDKARSFLAHNVFGGIGMVLNIAGGVLTTVVDSALPIFHGTVTQRRAAAYAFSHLLGSFAKSAGAGYEILRKGDQMAVLADTKKFFEADRVSREALSILKERAKDDAGQMVGVRLIEAMDWWEAKVMHNATRRGLAAGDEIILQTKFHTLLNRMAFNKAIELDQDINVVKDALTGKIELEGVTPMIRVVAGEPVFSKMANNAISEASYVDEAWRWVKAFAGFLESAPALKPVFVAVTTPANMTRRSFQYMPTTFLRKRGYTDYEDILRLAAEGDDLAKLRLQDIEARSQAGLVLAIPLILAGASGIATGTLPIKDLKGDAQRQLNIPKTGFRFGNTWFNYGKLGGHYTAPISMMVNIGVAARYVFDNGLGSPEEFTSTMQELMPAMALGFMESMLEGLPTRGVENLATLFSGGNAYGPGFNADRIMATLANIGSGFIPESGKLSAIYNARNPEQVAYASAFDRQLDRMTGGFWSMGQANNPDGPAVIPSFVTGEAKPNPWGGSKSLSPLPASAETQDKLLKRLTDDGFVEREAARGPNGMDLKPKDHQRIHELMFKLGARDALMQAIESAAYNDALLLPAPPKGRQPQHISILNSAISSIRRDAYDWYAKENPDFAARYADWKERIEASKGGSDRSPQRALLRGIEDARSLINSQ